QRALPRLLRPRREAAPIEEAGDLAQRPRREVGAVFTRGNVLPLEVQKRKIPGRRFQFQLKNLCIPFEAGVARLHRAVALAVQAEVEVEAVDLVPVLLPERVGEAAHLRAAGIDTDEI